MHLRAKSYGKLPSEFLRIEHALTAWNFDKHVHRVGQRFESLMQGKNMTVEKALRQLEQDDRPARPQKADHLGAMIASMMQDMKGKTA